MSSSVHDCGVADLLNHLPCARIYGGQAQQVYEGGKRVGSRWLAGHGFTEATAAVLQVNDVVATYAHGSIRLRVVVENRPQPAGKRRVLVVDALHPSIDYPIPLAVTNDSLFWRYVPRRTK